MSLTTALRCAAEFAPEGAAIETVGLDGTPIFNQPEVMVGAANESFDTVRNLTDQQTREYVRLLVQSLVDWMRRIGQ